MLIIWFKVFIFFYREYWGGIFWLIIIWIVLRFCCILCVIFVGDVVVGEFFGDEVIEWVVLFFFCYRFNNFLNFLE